MAKRLRTHPLPVLTRGEIPAFHPDLVDPSSVFNPGALRRDGVDHLLLRVQDRGRRTHLLPAWTEDGHRFQLEARELAPPADLLPGRRLHHVYDPRLSWLDGVCHLLAAADLDEGCRLLLARWPDFGELQWLGLTGEEDQRNGVLFTRRFGAPYEGQALRLTRPNRPSRPGEPASGSEIWLERSLDLLAWTPVACVARGRFHYWDELIGPGPPPVETEAGWLCVYHGVATHFASSHIYQAGVLLLDRHDPARVLGRSRLNILEPRQAWELSGQVGNVVFPSGLTTETDAEGLASLDEPFRLYYGAADTCTGLAEGKLRDLLEACEALEGDQE